MLAQNIQNSIESIKKSFKKRIFIYDFLRAFAIIQVFVCHILTRFNRTQTDFLIKEYINTIARTSVPIFLFLSGYFFKKVDLKKLLKKLKKILIPYFFASIVSTFLLIEQFHWHILSKQTFLSILFGYQFGQYFVFIIVYIYILGFLLKKLLRKTLFILFIFLTHIFYLQIDECLFLHFRLHEKYFYQFQTGDFLFYRNPFTWFFFFAFGFFLRENKKLDKFFKQNKKTINILFLFIFIFYSIQYFYFPLKTIEYTPYGSILWSIFSLLNILYLKYLDIKPSKKIKKIIIYLSKNSYYLFLIHLFFLFKIEQFLKNKQVPYAFSIIILLIDLFLTIGTIEILKKIKIIKT